MTDGKVLSDSELDAANGGLIRREGELGMGLKCPFCKQNTMKPVPGGKSFVCGSCGFTCNKEQLEV